MNEGTKVKLLAVAFVVVFAGVGAYVYLEVMKSAPAPEPTPVAEAAPPAPAPSPAPEAPSPAAVPELPTPAPEAKPWTDERIRAAVAGLSTDVELARWAHREHLIGKFIALTETLAGGRSPRSLVPFLAPEGSFPVEERKDGEFVDPKGYARYDGLAQAFASIDEAGAARLYRQLSPELERRYREMAPPGKTFAQQLARAIEGLLQVPEVHGDIPLDRIEVTLKIADPDLEAMSDAQKHLFRMGPGNIHLIQAKLRQLARAMGLDPALQTVKPLSCKICKAEP